MTQPIFPRLNVSDHALERGTIEIAARIAVIHIILILEHPMLFCEVPEHEFLVADAHTLIVAAVIQRDTAVESGDFFIDLFFSCS